MSNLLDALVKAQLPERTVSLCLNAPLLERLGEAESLARTSEAASQSRGEKNAETQAGRRQVRKYREAAEALRAEVDAEAVTVRMRALPFARYNAVVFAHPPRKGNDADAANGYNTASFFLALVRESIVDPDLDDATWDKLLEVINDTTWDLLAYTAMSLNRSQDAAVPFSATGSAATRG